MAELPAQQLLFVGAPDARWEGVVATLRDIGDVIYVDDLTSALEELSLGKPVLAIIDGALSDDEIAWILGALGDPSRALLWVPEPNPTLFEHGAVVQVPYSASEKTLAIVAQRLIEQQRMKLDMDAQRDRLARYDHVMRVVSEVRHAASSPLTSLLAEAELMLLDADQLSDEQTRSLETMQSMSHRMRDLLKRLKDLNLEK